MDTSELNLVVVRGKVAPGAQIRAMADGTSQLQWDLAVGGERIPVTWAAAPGDLPDPGQDMLVVGRVRRRFFRVAEHTQSRTEVVAERVLAGTDRRKSRRVLDEVVARMASG